MESAEADHFPDPGFQILDMFEEVLEGVVEAVELPDQEGVPLEVEALVGGGDKCSQLVYQPLYLRSW